MADELPIIGKKLNGGAWGMLIATIVINLAVATATLWVKSGYVSKHEFDSYRNEEITRRETKNEELKNIAVSLGEINIKLQANDRQDREIEEIKKRLTDEERRKK